MPLFEYRCIKCKRRFSLLEGMTAKKERRACPHCGSRQMTKLISKVAPIVRGDEFDDDFDDLNDEEAVGADMDDDYGDDWE